jgi:[ribosomal protein S5]-alanine N-acetyltransferase
MEIYIELIKEQDEPNLFQFEFNNRTFFEKMVPSRGEEYFNHFSERHSGLLKEQQEGTSYFYLIRNDSGDIVGRINLVDIDWETCSGSLGYRVGEAFTGKGVAGRALKLLLHEIKKYNVTEIHAKTTTHNIASQKVLERNDFIRTSISTDEIQFNGETVRFVHYIWKRD